MGVRGGGRSVRAIDNGVARTSMVSTGKADGKHALKPPALPRRLISGYPSSSVWTLGLSPNEWQNIPNHQCRKSVPVRHPEERRRASPGSPSLVPFLESGNEGSLCCESRQKSMSPWSTVPFGELLALLELDERGRKGGSVFGKKLPCARMNSSNTSGLPGR